MPNTSDFAGLLEWRCIGPFRGGRVVTVAGDYADPNTFYFGACAGGVWKTTDAGVYWENVSDGFFNTASIGALAVAPSKIEQMDGTSTRKTWPGARSTTMATATSSLAAPAPPAFHLV